MNNLALSIFTLYAILQFYTNNFTLSNNNVLYLYALIYTVRLTALQCLTSSL